MGKLYLVSTPIGNMTDVTFRALDVLFQVDLILSEDTRETLKLLNHYKKPTLTIPKLLSYHDHNREQRIPYVLKLLAQGQQIALVSDRGTPLLSDPGYKLVAQVIKLMKGNSSIEIDSVPGANALLPALQLSGLPPDRFCFVGFLPRTESKRQEFLKELPQTTIVAYESPQRLLESLNSIDAVLGNVPIAVVGDISKKYQKVHRGYPHEVIEVLESDTELQRGEFVLVLNLRR